MGSPPQLKVVTTNYEREDLTQDSDPVPPAWELERTQLLADLAQARQMLEELREAHARTLSDTEESAAIALEHQVSRAIERVHADLTTERDKLRNELAGLIQASQAWESDKQQLTSQYNKAKKLLDERTEAHARMLSDTEEGAAIALELQVNKAVELARDEFNLEKAALYKELEHLTQAANAWKVELTQWADEREQLRKQIAQGAAEHSRLVAELTQTESERERSRQTLSDARAEHEQSLADRENAAATTLELARTEFNDERNSLRRELDKLVQQARAWETERTQLATERDRANQAIAAATAEHQGALADFDSERNKLRQELSNLTQAARGWDTDRSELAKERDRATQGLAESKAEFERILANQKKEAAATLEREVTAALDGARSEFNSERDQLRQELSNLTQAANAWDADRTQLAGDRDRANQAFAESKAEYERNLATQKKEAAATLEREVTAALAQAKTEFQAERSKLHQELEQLQQATKTLNTERAQLTGERDRAGQLVAELKTEHQRVLADHERTAAASLDLLRAEFTAKNDSLHGELDHLARSAKNWESEKAQLADERERLRHQVSELESEQAQMLAEVTQLSGQRDRANQLLADTKAEHQKALTQHEEAAAIVLERQIAKSLDVARGDFNTELNRLRQELEQAARTSKALEAERDQLSHERDRFNQLLVDARTENERTIADNEKAAILALERQVETAVQQARAAAAAERDALRRDLEQRWASEREQLQHQLAAAEVAHAREVAERTVLMSERDRANQVLAESKAEHARILAESERATAVALKGQVSTAVELVRSELTAERDQLRREVERLTQAASTWDLDRAQWSDDRELMRQQLSKTEIEYSQAVSERARIALERDRASQALSEARAEHERILADTRKASTSTVEKDIAAAVKLVRAEFSTESERLIRELESLRHAAATWEIEKAQLNGERDSIRKRLAEAEAERSRSVSETMKSAESIHAHARIAAIESATLNLTAERDRLRQDLDKSKQSAILLEAEKNRLMSELEQAKRSVHAAAAKEALVASPSAAHTSRAVEALQTEADRVEGLIQAISDLINEPDTALSTAIRKNVERAELESYLKGIRYSLSSL